MLDQASRAWLPACEQRTESVIITVMDLSSGLALQCPWRQQQDVCKARSQSMQTSLICVYSYHTE
jgi:hypothetical protein